MASHDIDALVVHHRPVAPSTLKRLILLFDHVYVLDPREARFMIPDDVATYRYGRMTIRMNGYTQLYEGEAYEEQESKILDQFDYARDRGVVRILDLRNRAFFARNWLALRLAYDFDSADILLLRHCEPILEDIPDFSPKCFARGFFISPAGVNLYPRIPSVPDVFTDDKARVHGYYVQAASAIARLDRGLAACGQQDLVPVFISPVFWKMYQRKCELATSCTDRAASEAFLSHKGAGITAMNHVLYAIAEALLPDEVIDRVPIKELVIARNNTFEKLLKLRRRLASDITALRSQALTPDFAREVDGFLRKEFEPALRLYRDRFVEVLGTMNRHFATFVAGATGATIGLMQALTPTEIAFLSGVSAVAGSVASDLSRFVIDAAKQRFRNTYGYFLDMAE